MPNGKSRDGLVLKICFLFLVEQINKLVYFSEGFIKLDWRNVGANGMDQSESVVWIWRSEWINSKCGIFT